MGKIILHDPTLRDGNHAVKHKITLEQIKTYCRSMDKTGIDVIEVGHGLGLGASSLQLGMCGFTDLEMLSTARTEISKAKLGVHITPGYGREKDLIMAVEIGVDTVRVAAHCSEADLTQRLIERTVEFGIEAFVSLTMAHMLSVELLVEQVDLIQSYGASGVIIMDSAGALLPSQVANIFGHLKNNFDFKLGFHAHNNLGLSVANSLVALENGATIIDGTAGGFGAGAGNTPLEILAAVLIKAGYKLNIDLKSLLNSIEYCITKNLIVRPQVKANNIMTGLSGIFGGYEQKISRIAKEFHLDPIDIVIKLGEMKVIAGQEDKILEVAYQLKNQVKTA